MGLWQKTVLCAAARGATEAAEEASEDWSRSGAAASARKLRYTRAESYARSSNYFLFNYFFRGGEREAKL
jgi:hypothetical protein